MQITRVELRNIKNHAEAAWTFNSGVVAICGPNGAGKTTILEAIAWALFDHLDYNREDFIRRGAKKGAVTVGFIDNVDQREYVVTRETGGAYFVYDPETKIRLVEQKNQVLPWLKQHIGVEPEADLATLFKTTIGVPQGTFTYDFALAPAPRKKIFDQILKVEEYRQASDNLKDTLRHIEGRISEVDRKLAEAEGELKTYEEIKQRHDETATRLHSVETELKQADEARERALREVAAFDELRQQLTEQRSAFERLRMKLELSQNKLAAAQQSAEAARAAAAIVAAAQAGYETYQSAAQQLTRLEGERGKRDELRERSATTQRALMTAHNQIERVREKLDEIAKARLSLAELTTPLAQQKTVEELLARLREARGEAQSLKRSLESLDRELEKLRTRFTRLSKQIDEAEQLREKAERADTIEDERMNLTRELREKNQALDNYKVKRELLGQLQAELRRLATEQSANDREIARLAPFSQSASGLAESETQQQRDHERLAHLRAEVSRDAEMITALESGGVCPLLTEKCLNLKPGESLDARFRDGLQQRRREIKQLEASAAALTVELKQWRTQAAEAARLPKLHEEAARLSAALSEQQQRVAKTEDEIALGSTVSDGEIRQLDNKLLALDALLRDAREAQRLFSRTEPLRQELHLVKAGGADKRRERDELGKRFDKLGDVERQLAEAQSILNALNDPRGRATALEQLIVREKDWEKSAQTAEAKAAQINSTLEQINAELKTFADLDIRIGAATALRTASERDYQAFLANEKPAATVAACAADVATISADLGQTETSLKELGHQLEQLESRYDAERHQRAQLELVQSRDRATQLVTQLSHTREQFAQLQAQLASLNKVRQRMHDELAARDKLKKLEETTDFIRDILQKAAPYITEHWLRSISQEANQFFREITGRYDVTLQWMKDYEITLEEEGRERPFANLSGGEQMAAALAVRLALLRQLSEVNLAFFDEPTTNMDEERRRNLAQQIGRIKAFEQLFVISHDDSFESFTDQVITLAGKTDG